MKIISNLVKELECHQYSISDILRIQQQYHEKRRWSVYDVIGNRCYTSLSDRDKAALYHVARAEITTQPAGIRLAVDGVKLAQKLAKTNPLGSKVAHIAAAWSARYWLEEEAHHEVAYGILLEMAGIEAIGHEEVVEHRGFFPTDNYARVCMLQACVEIEASMMYREVAQKTNDPLIRDVFTHIMRDEVQHRQYFVSFARALVDAGVYPAKDILSMAYTWLRPGTGETHGSVREKQAEREGFVNWWEQVKTGDDELALHDEQIRSESLQYRKIRSVLAAVRSATGIELNSVDDLRRAYYDSLKSKNNNGFRLAANC